jgi:hypothetical protein
MRAAAVDGGVQPAGVVAVAEGRRDRVVDDLARRQVGHRAFERLGHLDAQRRSSLATTISRPSPTSRRPIFQASATRWA